MVGEEFAVDLISREDIAQALQDVFKAGKVLVKPDCDLVKGVSHRFDVWMGTT